ncbi:hypothetical protein [Lyngbya sp. PCC 8106]|nr:hypothetical protein [Lyngbya sp. PCC 8106]EAW33957.1 hypothetical protein L8106_08676 [Lyngbya sp. PCC 8106]
MQPQATRVEKLILSALIAFVTATASATVEIHTKADNSLPNLNSVILADR